MSYQEQPMGPDEYITYSRHILFTCIKEVNSQLRTSKGKYHENPSATISIGIHRAGVAGSLRELLKRYIDEGWKDGCIYVINDEANTLAINQNTTDEQIWDFVGQNTITANVSITLTRAAGDY